jgi:spermidine synthase
MEKPLHPQGKFIFQEMMSHPALFSHPHPKKIGILGDQNGSILKEVSKHPVIAKQWRTAKNSFDIVINAESCDDLLIAELFQSLHPGGILVQSSGSPFNPNELKSTIKQLESAEFTDVQILSFPQPDYAYGWRSALMAIKQGGLYRVREKDIFNKKFKTMYYNFDVHKAALVLPEFLKKEGILT